jgi:hypothetical protein
MNSSLMDVQQQRGGGGGMLRQQAMSDPQSKKRYLTQLLRKLGQKRDLPQSSVDFLKLKHHRDYLKILATLFCTFSYRHHDPGVDIQNPKLYVDLLTTKENEQVHMNVSYHHLQFITTQQLHVFTILQQ